MKLDRTIFKQLANKYLLWVYRREQARTCVLCDVCKKGFNAKWQSGLCPHRSIEHLVKFPETPREILECTREAGHTGPCNGWPCKSVRQKIKIH